MFLFGESVLSVLPTDIFTFCDGRKKTQMRSRKYRLNILMFRCWQILFGSYVFSSLKHAILFNYDCLMYLMGFFFKHKTKCVIKHVSQDLTFLYSVRSPSRSSRPVWWILHLLPLRCSLPTALVPRTTPMGGHIFVTTCMHVAVPPDPPIKEAVLAKSVSQSLAPELTTLQGS